MYMHETTALLHPNSRNRNTLHDLAANLQLSVTQRRPTKRCSLGYYNHIHDET